MNINAKAALGTLALAILTAVDVILWKPKHDRQSEKGVQNTFGAFNGLHFFAILSSNRKEGYLRHRGELPGTKRKPVHLRDENAGNSYK